MEAKKKAIELYNMYLPLVQGGHLNETYHNKAKICAKLSVDEIINYLTTSENILTSIHAIDEWVEVGKEIANL